jgi:hypothetical protein
MAEEPLGLPLPVFGGSRPIAPQIDRTPTPRRAQRPNPRLGALYGAADPQETLLVCKRAAAQGAMASPPPPPPPPPPPTGAGFMDLRVKTLAPPATHTLPVAAGTTVAQLKGLIAARVGTPPARQRLIWRGGVLSDSDTMGQLGAR